MKVISSNLILFLILFTVGCKTTHDNTVRTVKFFTTSQKDSCVKLCNPAEKAITAYIKRNPKVILEIIDISKAPEVITEFNIHGYPTIITFVNGKETGRSLGYIKDPKKLSNKLDGMLEL